MKPGSSVKGTAVDDQHSLSVRPMARRSLNHPPGNYGKCSIATSVLGHFGSYSLRSFLWGPNWQRTEVTKDRSGCPDRYQRPKWRKTEPERTELDIYFKNHCPRLHNSNSYHLVLL